MELARVLVLLASLAGAGASIAMHLGRLQLHPWLRVVAYPLPAIAVIVLIIAGLRAPRYPLPLKMPLVFKVLAAGVLAFAAIHVAVHLRHGGAFTLSDESADGRRAVTSCLLFAHTLVVTILWRRFPKRPSRL